MLRYRIIGASLTFAAALWYANHEGAKITLRDNMRDRCHVLFWAPPARCDAITIEEAQALVPRWKAYLDSLD